MNKKLLKLLEDNHIKHEIIIHKTVYTAYDAAQTMKVKLNQIAKSLLVKTNKPLEHGQKPYALALVPADKNIDLKKLAKIMTTKELRITKVEIPKENVMKTQFNVKPGSMAAFGSLYKIPVFVDKNFKGEIIFPAGSFTESLKMKVGDYLKLEAARVGLFSIPKKIKKSVVKAKPKSKKTSPKKKVVKKKK